MPSPARMPKTVATLAAATLALLIGATLPASAAEGIDGTTMAWPWALPFVGILMSIATGPLLFPKFWHAHYGKIAAVWAIVTLAAIALAFGVAPAFESFNHAMLLEYVSFIMLLFALYTVAGGIVVTGQIRATPWSNTAMLAVGAVAASFIGTTGASMILIRPMIRANDERPYNVHVFVFFIFLVSNIGGSLTPLGDPPLFVGFLRGVDFFWTMQNMLPETAFLVVILLALFFAVDWWFWRREPRPLRDDTAPPQSLGLRGIVNVVLLAAIIAAVLAAAAWRPGVTLHVPGADLALENVVRDIALLVIALLSLVLTPTEHRDHNAFTWEPIAEVAKLFAAIFICVIPVLAMLNAGRAGPFAWLLQAVTAANGTPHEIAYFWLTGILSAFLDNAPTYLVFFELAGGNAQTLMTDLALTLAAISSGAVFMGALSYIGNAPNFMVYAIAVERGIRMPSFFGYMAWSFLILLPLFGLLTLFFFTVS